MAPTSEEIRWSEHSEEEVVAVCDLSHGEVCMKSRSSDQNSLEQLFDMAEGRWTRRLA
jgi:hypothetical protein